MKIRFIIYCFIRLKKKDLIEASDKNSGYTNLCLKDLWKISDTVFVEVSN